MSQERSPHLGMCHGAGKRQTTPQRPQEHWHFPTIYFVSAETDTTRLAALCLGCGGSIDKHSPRRQQPRLEQATLQDVGASGCFRDSTSRGRHTCVESAGHSAPGRRLVASLMRGLEPRVRAPSWAQVWRGRGHGHRQMQRTHCRLPPAVSPSPRAHRDAEQRGE